MPREGTGMSWMSGQLHSPASLPPGRNPGTHFIGVLDCPKGGVTKLSHYRPGQVLRAAGRWDSQNFETVGTWRRSVLRTGRLYPQEEPLYSYLVVSTTGPKCGRKEKVNEKSRWPIGNRTRDLPACSALPQPITPPRTAELVRSWEKSLVHYRIGTPDRPACSVVSPSSVSSFPSDNKQHDFTCVLLTRWRGDHERLSMT